MSTETFNLNKMQEYFTASLHEEDDVNIQEYLDSYEEINKFFNLMGTIFSFVSSDLQAKMDILRDYLVNNEVATKYKTVKTMLEYEKENSLLEKSGYTSGSRTLLRLHRGLDFIKEFLKRLEVLTDTDNTAHTCREAYNLTLAKHHTFVIRNGAKLAMYALPTREQLLLKVCIGDTELIKKSLEILPETLATTELVYNRIENLYTQYDLHSLP